MVQRFGFDEDDVTWGPNDNGPFVPFSDYDALAAQLAEVRKQQRWNIERTEDGVRICENTHHRSQDCEWVEYVPRAQLAEAVLHVPAHAELRIQHLEAQLAAAERDAEARSLYDRTAAAHGFTNAPHWNDLAEETRQMYRDERAKRDALERQP